MLNIEIVKFEAQDVITASGAATACAHDGTVSFNRIGDTTQWEATCDLCGEKKGPLSGIIYGPFNSL